MAFKFEEQLCLPIADLVERENEKRITRQMKLALCTLYGTLSLIGGESRTRRAALDSIRVADEKIAKFLKEYFTFVHQD